MQVLCKASTTGSDVRCSICGQAFLVYWERSTLEEQAEARLNVLQALRSHHLSGQTSSQNQHAHPQTAFNVPEWNGMPQFSAAALLGNAPKWAA